jgi:CHAD domain-containing protein
MPPELTSDLLVQPAAHAARVIAREHLANVSAQFDRFLTGNDASLHDLRVALRRLRSWIRAYQPELEDTVRKKTRRGLRKLARATNPARDAEVMVEWIEQQTELSARERAGASYLGERLTNDRDEADSDAREQMNDKLPKLIAALSKELLSYWVRYDVDNPMAPRPMARVTRDTIVAQAERLSRAMDRVESLDDARAIHRVRIAAKRLRYLLETIADPTAAALVERVTALQDSLGVCHDMHGMVNRIVRELGELGARDAHVAALSSILDEGSSKGQPRFAKCRPGLIALATRARRIERDAYARFRAEWTEAGVARMVADVSALGDGIVVRGAVR